MCVEVDKDMNIWIIFFIFDELKFYLDCLVMLSFEVLFLWGILFVIKDNIDVVYVLMIVGCKEYMYIFFEYVMVV